MAIVCVWVHPSGFSSERPGHCAIEINGTYISHHPGAADGLKWNLSGNIQDQGLIAQATRMFLAGSSARTSKLFSYREDCNESKREPEYIIELNGLPNEHLVNTSELKRAFQGVKYSFFGQNIRSDAMNCVQAVMTCLDGLLDGRLRGWTEDEGKSPVFPMQVAEYAYAVQQYSSRSIG